MNQLSSQKNIDIVFKEIYDKFYKLVAFCIARYVKSKQDVEDLSDDVFVNFYKHINSIEISNIKYYLTTSAKNTSLNFLRSFHETDELNEELLVDEK
jgi:DNA-directed RNA polymerase specialized sigma24 family protein